MLTGSLQYLTITNLDVTFTINKLCQHMHAPSINHFLFLRWLWRYIKGTISYGLMVSADNLILRSYSDFDWASDQTN